MDGQMDEVRIGSHILQTSRQLLMNGERVHLGPRALDILTVLAKANGEIVTKDELFEAVWPGQVIEENALHAHITAIRKALEEDAGLLETIRGIGYQLHTSVGEDAVAPDALVEPAPAPLAPSSIPSDTPEAPIAGVQAVPPSKGAHRRKLLAGAAAAVLALIGVAYVATVGLPGPSEALAQEPVTVAIMPFKVVGDFEEGDEQLGAGMAGALNTSLSQLSGLALTSNSAPSQLAQGGMAMPEIAEQLGVEYFIEGEIQYIGKEVVLSLSLLEGKTTRQIWRDQVRNQRELLPIVGEDATREIARAIQARLGVGDGEIADSSGVDPEAYEAYLRGMQHPFGSANGRLLAFEEFRRSVRLDPDFAPAHAGLGWVLSSGVEGQFATPEGDALAKSSIEQALQLDPQNLMARTAQWLMISNREGEFDAAFEGLRDIIETHPDYSLAHWGLAHELSRVGEHAEALEHSRKASRSDPLRTEYSQIYLLNLLALGRYYDIRAEATNCIDCASAVIIWAQAVAWIADDADYSRELDIVVDRLEGMGFPKEDANLYRESVIASREGRPINYPASEWPVGTPNVLAVASFGEFEAALDMLDRYPLKPFLSGDLIFFLDTPHEEWPAAVRADPRYHACFSSSPVSGIEERRRRGHTKHLPVFPVKPYEGP